jgi:hypothetical protein
MWWIYIVYLYGSRTMKPAEIILRGGKMKESDGGSESN